MSDAILQSLIALSMSVGVSPEVDFSTTVGRQTGAPRVQREIDRLNGPKRKLIFT